MVFLTSMHVGEEKTKGVFIMTSYTNENCVEDMAIANEVYRIHFNGLRHIREDLVQEAIIKLWQKRAEYKGGGYKTFATKTAKNAMYDFLRKEINHLDSDVSIFEEIADGQRYIDILEIEQDTCDIQERNKAMMIGMIKMYISGCDEQTQKIFDLFAKGLSHNDISKEIGLARSCITERIMKLRNDIATRVVEVRK